MKFLLDALFWTALLLIVCSGALLLMNAVGLDLPRWAMFAVFVPAMLLSVPAILIGKMLTASFTEKEIRKKGMKLILRGCPPWVEKTIKIVGWLAIISFFLVLLTPKPSRDALMQRFMFPIYAMFLSAYADAIAYSALHTDNSPRHCLNGHEIAATHTFCPVCGSPSATVPTK